MKISQTIQSLRGELQHWRGAGQSIGLVPTMGHLHDGHMDLVRQAQACCDRVVVSIFVNPLQFNEAADFAAYPKTLQADQQKLVQAGVDLLFLPDNELMYPQGQTAITRVSVPVISEELEGAFRPGHFDGVATVVNKLFNLVQPDQAFFGEKDYQQLLLVRKMVADLNMPVKIFPVATRREADGLAMSSRNSLLTAEQRSLAPGLYEQLKQFKLQLEQGGASLSQLEAQALEKLRQLGFEPEYVSLRSAEDLSPTTTEAGRKVLLAAARLGDVRLIDNIQIELN